MKLLLPNNIYSKIFSELVKNVEGLELAYNQSSLLCKDLEYNTSAVALIPSLELINHRNLFVSSNFAFSFHGEISNSYLYFGKKDRKIEKIFFRGDVSINEILLTKILFSEKYLSEPEINLDPSAVADKERNYIVSGDENYLNWDYRSGISIADEISELIDLPYLNFVFASPDREALIKLNGLLSGISFDFHKNEELLAKSDYTPDVLDFIKENSGSLYFDMTENEKDAAEELIKLLFYRGMIDDMFDIKYVP